MTTEEHFMNIIAEMCKTPPRPKKLTSAYTLPELGVRKDGKDDISLWEERMKHRAAEETTTDNG